MLFKKKSMGRKTNPEIVQIADWFQNSVTYEGEPFTLDHEQVAAVISEHQNTLVAARAGSGKTRTIVAKIAYLIAKKHIDPGEILVFVFNANAAAEVNERANKILVNNCPIGENIHVAHTFHSFARQIAYQNHDFGDILAEEKSALITNLVQHLDPKIIYNFNHLDPSLTTKFEFEEAKSHFANLICQFIDRAEQEFLDDPALLKSKITKITDQKTKLYLDTGLSCFEQYLSCLRHNLKHRPICQKTYRKYGIDFNLLIKVAADEIIKNPPSSLKSVKYLLVDEYQDFSKLFLALLSAIRTACPTARLFTVGDDWQAINRFAGSNVAYFNDFAHVFSEDAVRLEISTNYRCDRAIVDNARHFIKKSLKEPAHFSAFHRTDGDIHLETAASLDQYLEVIAKIIATEKTFKSILLLHRNNEMSLRGITLDILNDRLKSKITSADILTPEAYDEKVHLMTMHRSKGLEADTVIILEANDGVIPSHRSDSNLYEIFGETEKDTLEDQMRLFYVAITRAKHHLYIIKSPKSHHDFTDFLPKNLLISEDK